MARYTGPRLRISRRLRTPIFGASKYLDRKDYPPGQHGQSRRRKATDYALALIEKQKLRFYYGLMEKQFRGVYEKANRRRIKSYRGQRHQRGLPTRGQRTQTNARTRKGPKKTVGAQRKKD